MFEVLKFRLDTLRQIKPLSLKFINAKNGNLCIQNGSP